MELGRWSTQQPYKYAVDPTKIRLTNQKKRKKKKALPFPDDRSSVEDVTLGEILIQKVNPIAAYSLAVLEVETK